MAERPCKNPNCNSYGVPHPNCQCYGGYAQGGMASGSFCDAAQPHKAECQYAKGGTVKAEGNSFFLEEDTPTHYVVKHPRGDILKIAKNGLSKDMHAHMSRMAKGGQVKPKQQPAPQPTPNPISQGFNSATGMSGIKQASQNVTQRLNEGGYASEVEQSTTPMSGGQAPVTININSGQPQNMTPMQPQAPPPEAPAQAQSLAGPRAPTVSDAWQGAKEFLTKPMGAPLASPENIKKYGSVDQAILAERNQGLQPQNMGHPTMPGPQLAANPGAAITIPELPAPNIGQQQPMMPAMPFPQTPTSISNNERIAQQALDDSIKYTNQIRERLLGVGGQGGLLKDYMDDEIKPQRLFENKGAWSKILAGIGIALGGAAAGVTGGPNQALEMINKEIERDVEAQKANLGKKGTLLEKYLAAYGDVNQAAHAQIQDAQALVAMELVKHEMKMKQGMMQGMQMLNSGQMTPSMQEAFVRHLSVISPEQGKALAGHIIPGIGMATREVSDKHLEDISKRVAFHKSAEEVRDLAHKVGGLNAYDPKNLATLTYAKSRAQELLSAFRNAQSMGVPKELVVKMEKQIFDPDITKFFGTIRTDPQIQALIDTNLGELNSTLGTLGAPKYGENQGPKAVSRKGSYVATSHRKSK